MADSIIVVGASAGGLEALSKLLRLINHPLSSPMVITKHVGNGDEDGALSLLNKASKQELLIAGDKEELIDGNVYLASGGYHLQVESSEMLSLCTGELVSYSKPSVDVLFSSAAEVFGCDVIGIILTGANRDGAEGVKTIKQAGGITIAQKPETAEVSIMPQAAINTGCVDYTMDLAEIADFLNTTKK